MKKEPPKKEKLYSLREIALMFGLGSSGFFYYRRKLEEYIPTVGKGRMRRYPEEAVPIFDEIVELRKAGWSLNKIKIYFEANKEKVNPKPPKVTKEGEQPSKRKMRTYVLK